MPAIVNRHRCARHGMLPVDSFYPSDLQLRRRRCKQCSHELKRDWLAKHPAQRMWKTFVQRAKRRFGTQALDGVSWSTHGRHLLGTLADDIAQRIDAKGQHLRLEWPAEDAELHLDRLLLSVTKQRHMRLTKAAPSNTADTGAGTSAVKP